MWRRQDTQRAWRGIIDASLLSHLVARASQQHRLRPWHLLLVVWVLATVALAGPTWQREPSPFTADQAALAIVVKVTPSMLAKDVQPTRLERAVQKMHDLLALRSGAKAALIAYAGSAHMVLPLTSDANIIDTFAAALSPRIMPTEGDEVGKALALANDIIVKSGQPGSILLIADSIAADQSKALAAHRRAGGAPVNALAVAADQSVPVPPDSPPAPPLDRAAFKRAMQAVGGTLTVVTPDNHDVRTLAGRVETRWTAVQTTTGGERWQDAGYWLVPLLVLLGCVWFRPGWLVSYS
jgi:Ca-activated chloride channel family protein